LTVENTSTTTPALEFSANNAGQYLDNIVTSTLGSNSINFVNTDTTDSASYNGQISGAITFETSDADSSGINAFIASSAEGTTGQGRLAFGTGTGGTVTKRQNIASNGDISFYDSTGSTPKFFWDAADERLGIGTSDPDAELHILETAQTPTLRLESTHPSGVPLLELKGAGGNAQLKYVNELGVTQSRIDLRDGGEIRFNDVSSGSTVERMRIDSSGIDVTGTVTADGLTVDTAGTALVLNQASTGWNTYIDWKSQGTSTWYQRSLDADNGMDFYAAAGSGRALKLDSNGDISFYDSTGDEAKFFWDASAEGLGIGTGTTTLTTGLEINSTQGHVARFTNSAMADNSDLWILFGKENATAKAGLLNYHYDTTAADSYILLRHHGDSTGVQLQKGGNVGIGTDNPTEKLHVVGNIAVSGTVDGYDIAGTFGDIITALDAINGEVI